MRKRAEVHRLKEIVKDLIWLLFGSALLTSGLDLEEPTQFAGSIYRMSKLGLSIADGEEEELLELTREEMVADSLWLRRIVKESDGVKFVGHVSDISIGSITGERLYLIKYEDGDNEHMTIEEAQECMCSDT
mmetsp:Transcript_29128/g.39345  ORF Transcript_29128/g.39345 Transcript_29128/m.39345 type:complete len:132 (-) Transcript_29128:220-615(-)